MSVVRVTAAEKFEWQAPKDYIKKNNPERVGAKSILWRIVAGGAVERLLWEAARHFFEKKQYALAALVVFAMILLIPLLRAMEPVPEVTVGSKIALDGRKVSAGSAVFRWSSILWYRMAPVEEFAAYRALEMEAERYRSKKTLVRLVFDPEQVDEYELNRFLDDVAPTKRWEH